MCMGGNWGNGYSQSRLQRPMVMVSADYLETLEAKVAQLERDAHVARRSRVTDAEELISE